jgi:hypothetical protein
MSREHFIYSTPHKPGTEGTVHLATSTRRCTSVRRGRVRTLCGIPLDRLFESDETLSGYLATCGRAASTPA